MGKSSLEDKWTKHQRKRLAPNTLTVTHTCARPGFRKGDELAETNVAGEVQITADNHFQSRRAATRTRLWTHTSPTGLIDPHLLLPNTHS